jgi:hypothetical protein
MLGRNTIPLRRLDVRKTCFKELLCVSGPKSLLWPITPKILLPKITYTKSLSKELICNDMSRTILLLHFNYLALILALKSD